MYEMLMPYDESRANKKKELKKKEEMA